MPAFRRHVVKPDNKDCANNSQNHNYDRNYYSDRNNITGKFRAPMRAFFSFYVNL